MDQRQMLSTIKHELIGVTHKHRVDLDALTEYLRAWWGIDFYTARAKVRAFSKGVLGRRPIKKHGVFVQPMLGENNPNPTRIVDYLSARGVPFGDMEHLLPGIEQISPTFWRGPSKLPVHPCAHKVWQAPMTQSYACARDIRERLVHEREEKNISIEELAKHLTQHWPHARVDGSLQWINRLESGSLLKKLDKAHRQKLRSRGNRLRYEEERIADYLAALGSTDYAYDILEGIDDIQPRFLYLRSSMAGYVARKKTVVAVKAPRKKETTRTSPRNSNSQNPWKEAAQLYTPKKRNAAKKNSSKKKKQDVVTSNVQKLILSQNTLIIPVVDAVASIEQSPTRRIVRHEAVNECTDEELDEIARCIKGRLVEVRSRTQVSIENLGNYFGSRWFGIRERLTAQHRMNCATAYIDTLERGGNIRALWSAHRRQRKGTEETYLHTHEGRIADLLAALGVSEEIPVILDGIRQIQPRFRYLSSNVGVYRSKVPAARTAPNWPIIAPELKVLSARSE
jgi:hypothetical protein